MSQESQARAWEKVHMTCIELGMYEEPEKDAQWRSGLDSVTGFIRKLYGEARGDNIPEKNKTLEQILAELRQIKGLTEENVEINEEAPGLVKDSLRLLREPEQDKTSPRGSQEPQSPVLDVSSIVDPEKIKDGGFYKPEKSFPDIPKGYRKLAPYEIIEEEDSYLYRDGKVLTAKYGISETAYEATRGYSVVIRKIPRKQYRILQNGETVKRGDEFAWADGYNPDCWKYTQESIGSKTEAWARFKFRRPLEPEWKDATQEEPAISAGKKNGNYCTIDVEILMPNDEIKEGYLYQLSEEEPQLGATVYGAGLNLARQGLYWRNITKP